MNYPFKGGSRPGGQVSKPGQTFKIAFQVMMIIAGADPDCSERSSSISQILRESVHNSFEK